jgi:hypothetical protein
VLTGVSATRTEKNAGTYTTTASGTDGNYDLTFVDGAMVIGKANATVTANGAALTYNGANQTTSGFSATGLVGGEGVSVLTGVTASRTEKNAGTYTTTASGTDANYDLAFVDGAMVIGKASATVTANGAALTYNGANQTTSGFMATGLVGGEAASVLTGVSATRTEKNAGTYTTTASGTDGNYDLTFVDGAMVIGKASATVTANGAALTYNGANQTTSGFTATGLVGGEAASVLTGVSATRTEKNAGSYTTTASGTDGNYDLTFVDGAMVIGKASATVTANGAALTYNGANQTTSGFTATGLVGGEAASVLTGVSATRTEKNAGTYTTTASGTDGNYNLTFVDGAMVIAKAPLTATGNSLQLRYSGTTQSVVGYTVSGMQGGDNASDLTGISASGASGMNVGSYANTVTVADQPNYTVTGVNGSLYISAAPITLINGALQGAVSKTYDGTNVATLSASNYVLTGWLGGDLATVSKTTGTFDSANAGAGKTVSVDLTPGDYLASGSTDLLNYILPRTITGAVGQISKATLTPTVTARNKVYDATATANGAVSLAGVFSVDAATASAVAAGYSFADANVGTAKTVTATGISLGSGLNSNYALSSTSATGTANITPAPLTVTAINDAKFVTQADTAGYAGYAVTGLLGGETAASAGIAAGVALTRSNAAMNLADVYADVLVPSGNAAIGNYALSYVLGNYTIVPAGQLLVSTTSSNITYGTTGNNPIASVSYLDANGSTIHSLSLSGQAVVSGATVYTYTDGASGTASFAAVPTGTALSAGGNVKVGSYGLVAEQFSKTTNNLTSNTATVTGNLTVQPLAVTVAATPGTTTYNGSTQTQASTSGVLSGDAVTLTGAVSQRNAGIYRSDLAAAGTDVGNYSVTYANSNYTVNPALLRPTFAARDKVYDGNTTASLTASDNRISGDALTVTATGNFADKNVSSAKSVAVSGVSLSGADARNYTVDAVGGNPTASITRLAQVSWVGGTTGSWFDPANWAGGAVPDLANVANITIPAGVTVSFDNAPVGAAQAGLVQLESLITAGSLAMTAGALNVGAGGIQLNTLTQSGGALTSSGAVAVASLSQTAGSLTAGSLSTTTAFNQSGVGSINVTGQAQIAATAAPVVLGQLTVGGNLSVNSTGGGITQTGPVTVAGATSLNAGTFDVLLNDSNNSFAGAVTVIAAHSVVAGRGGIPAEPEVAPSLPTVPVVVEPRLALSQMPYRVTVAKWPGAGESGLVHIEIKDALVEQQIALPQALQEWIAASAPVIQSDNLDTNGAPAVRLSKGGVLSVIALADGLPSPVILKSATGEWVLRIVKAP